LETEDKPLIESVAGEQIRPPTVAPTTKWSLRGLVSGGHELEAKVLELQKWVTRARGKGRSPTPEERARAQATLQAATRLMRQSGFPDEAIVREIYLQILGRIPASGELMTWRVNLPTQDFDVTGLVESLIRSPEFVNGPRQVNEIRPVAPLPAMPAPARSKNARVQALYRIIYDMPNDKAEKLATFLNDNVLGEIEAHTEKDALVVTAEVGIQGRVAGIVSLMTGEPVVLDLRGGLPSFEGAIQAPGDHDPQTGATSYRPRPLTAQPVAPSTFTARPTERRELRTRTVYETDPTTDAVRPRTIIEEHVWPGEPAKNREPTVEPGFTAPVETLKNSSAVNGDPAIGP
jgi:hypothetical protein